MTTMAFGLGKPSPGQKRLFLPCLPAVFFHSYRLPFPVFQASLSDRIKEKWPENMCHLFALFQRKGWDMKSHYVSLRKNPADSPENKKISYPGKGTRFGKHLFITCLKIEFTLCIR